MTAPLVTWPDDPYGLWATTEHLTDCPLSALVSLRVRPELVGVAFRNHLNENELGSALQLPGLQVTVLPTFGAPEIDGSDLFAGAIPLTRLIAAALTDGSGDGGVTVTEQKRNWPPDVSASVMTAGVGRALVEAEKTFVPQSPVLILIDDPSGSPTMTGVHVVA